MDKWDPKRPWTWDWARPPESEVEAVKDQIDFATDYEFLGTVHIPHVSVKETVDIVEKARSLMFITCGVTPHHLNLSKNNMHENNGIMYKVNPPIREILHSSGLRDRLKMGKINWIETDHAPHTLEDKTERFMSGIPSLENYFDLLKKLKREWDFSFKQISDLTYYNIKKVFKKIIE